MNQLTVNLSSMFLSTVEGSPTLGEIGMVRPPMGGGALAGWGDVLNTSLTAVPGPATYGWIVGLAGLALTIFRRRL